MKLNFPIFQLKKFKKFHLNGYFGSFNQKHSMTLIISEKRKSFHYFASFSFHDFNFSEKVKITQLVSLLLYHFHSATLMIRKNENHSMTFISFTSISSHTFDTLDK